MGHCNATVRAAGPSPHPMSDQPRRPSKGMRPIPNFIFASRWLQLPLYIGLIAAQGVYVYHFLVELTHLIEAVFGSQTALQALVSSIGYKSDVALTSLNETVIMLVVLAILTLLLAGVIKTGIGGGEAEGAGVEAKVGVER